MSIISLRIMMSLDQGYRRVGWARFMFFCWTRQLIFVHVYKTGGTSIADALYSNLTRPERLFYRAGRYVGQRRFNPLACWHYQNLPQHITASQLRAILPKSVFENFFKFGFVRNPWSLQLSLYRYVRRSPDHPQYAEFAVIPDFPSYLEWLATRPNGRHVVQCDFLMDQERKPLVDFIGRFENLAEDFAFLAARFGWPTPLPHLNNSGAEDDFRRYYSPRTRDIVAELHREDIEAFGYRFD